MADMGTLTADRYKVINNQLLSVVRVIKWGCDDGTEYHQNYGNEQQITLLEKPLRKRNFDGGGAVKKIILKWADNVRRLREMNSLKAASICGISYYSTASSNKAVQ
jgi:hypothetical protein